MYIKVTMLVHIDKKRKSLTQGQGYKVDPRIMTTSSDIDDARDSLAKLAKEFADDGYNVSFAERFDKFSAENDTEIVIGRIVSHRISVPIG